jgi:hypothetical protein
MDDMIGKYFLIIETPYLLTFLERNTYWVIEFIDGQTIYGYNSFYGSSLIFNHKDIRILGHE